MFKQLFKLTVVSVIWKRYKAGIVSTLCLLVYYWLVVKVHADFLQYATMQSAHASGASVGLSFIFKWLMLIAGVLVYLAFNFWRRPVKVSKDLPHVKGSHKKSHRKNTENADSNNTHAMPSAPDPFAHLREKKHLRSKADFVIQQTKND